MLELKITDIAMGYLTFEVLGIGKPKKVAHQATNYTRMHHHQNGIVLMFTPE